MALAGHDRESPSKAQRKHMLGLLYGPVLRSADRHDPPFKMAWTVYIHIHILTYIHIHTYIHNTYIHACMHTYIHTYILTYLHTCIHTYIHTYIRTCVHTCIRTYVHTYIHTYYMHTYIHTYIHKYICKYAQSCSASWRAGRGGLRIAAGSSRATRPLHRALDLNETYLEGQKPIIWGCFFALNGYFGVWWLTNLGYLASQVPRDKLKPS